FPVIDDPGALHHDAIGIADRHHLGAVATLDDLAIAVARQALVVDLAAIARETVRIVMANDVPVADRDDDARILPIPIPVRASITVTAAVPVSIAPAVPIAASGAIAIGPAFAAAELRTTIDAFT